MENEATDHDSETPYEPSSGGTGRTPRSFPFSRVLIVFLVTAGIIAILQALAPSFDHQIANMVSIVCGILAFLYAAFEFHRTSASRGAPLLAPLVVVAVIGSFFALFRVDGFSGEMMPNLKLRFAPDDRPEWKEVAVSIDANSDSEKVDEAGEANENFDSGELDSSDQSLVMSNEIDFPQFLGPNRNGVLPKRFFSVPTDALPAKKLWEQGIGQGWASFAVASGRAVTLEQRDDQECVTCYRIADGELLWIHQREAFHHHALGGAGPRSTPTIHNGRVYAMGATGFLRCIDLLSGEMVWTKDFLQLAGWNQLEFEAAVAWGHSSSPLIVPSIGACVLSFGGPVDQNASDDEGMTDKPKSLIALDLDSGEEIWRAGRDQISYASPMLMNLAGLDQIVSVNEKTVTGHHVTDGQTLWSFPWPGASNGGASCSSAMYAGRDQILLGKGYGGGSALLKIASKTPSGMTATDSWVSGRTLRTKFNHSCIAGDVAYAIDNGSLQAAEVSTGEKLWTQPRRSRLGQGQVLLVEDTLVCQAEFGDVVFVDANPDEYRELARLPALESKTWNIPTVYGRVLMVRNDRRAICFELPERSDD